ncbi:MAG: hypothetical protein GYB31_12995 [Bacteroidetes bacterium]|nr:hypothetical protein [Bacteroidota bacterium]
MKEKNRETLLTAIRELPQHEPAPTAWRHIRQQLADAPLHTAIRDLPDLDPPEDVWTRISNEIKPEAKVRSLKWRPWAAAAGFLLLLAATLVLNDNIFGGNQLKATISYSVEEVDDRLLLEDWNADEEEFAVLNDLCSQHPFMCNRPDVQNLRLELNELTDAKMELVDVLGPYGTDVYLIEQLNEIEMERTKLLKQILTQVI